MNADGDSEPLAKERSVPAHGSNGDTHERKGTEDAEQQSMAELDTLQLLFKQFHELREYFSYYVTARTDGVRLSLRNISLRIVMTLLGFIALAGIILAAIWLVLSGTAEGLGVLCGGRAWAGRIIAGVLWLSVLGLGMCFTVVRRNIASQERTLQKYEQRKAQQEADFGRNVSDRAAAASGKQ